jgi:hypothetical protein
MLTCGTKLLLALF